MSIDVLVLNTAVTDFRGDFPFADKLVGKGGLAKCRTEDMPPYTQEQFFEWTKKRKKVTAGGPGNAAPPMARAGLDVGVCAVLGKGDYSGLDAQGSFFYDVMAENGVDRSHLYIHPTLPTGTTFIHELPGNERGGIAYFPNANNDFSFEEAKRAVADLKPKIVYYMYSGLSDRGDANQGKDLAEFMRWCRLKHNCIVIADSHTLTGDVEGVIKSGRPVEEYKLLTPLLPELDLFFTSYDEARMIGNTLDGYPTLRDDSGRTAYICNFLDSLIGKNITADRHRNRLFGLTVKNGAFFTSDFSFSRHNPRKVSSRFMVEGVNDLVGAGDSFRAGLLTYIAKHVDKFRAGELDFNEAVQMGNLFATLYIVAPLDDRYCNIQPYRKMLGVARNGKNYARLDDLKADLA
jgi:sugar/nucleoside kinase (ribokinase family)